MTVSKKNGIWYQHGFDSADRQALLNGTETPQLMRQIVGNLHGYPLHRYPKKSDEFTRGYWDSIESQRNKKAVQTPNAELTGRGPDAEI